MLLNPGTTNTEILDANKGAGGDFIYIAYKLTADRNDAITDIRVASGDNDNASISGYTKINVDLNKNAGGKYLYLCYKKATTDEEPRLKEIRGVYSDNENAYTLPGNWKWTNDKTDLHWDAKGKYVYLAFRTDK
ncbi:hypothetical protein SDC9_199164 [bioreactor metagenome]|uniref:MABP domain-containing protein n=1 Tax=bioreactor metagenome TaxID=1076179 RepID=A0A645IKH0_9ZZZZ